MKFDLKWKTKFKEKISKRKWREKLIFVLFWIKKENSLNFSNENFIENDLRSEIKDKRENEILWKRILMKNLKEKKEEKVSNRNCWMKKDFHRENFVNLSIKREMIWCKNDFFCK